MNKPLHKDPSFWIVAVVLVVAADLTQLRYGVPWFLNKVMQMQSAPRMTPQARPSVVSYRQPTNPAHKPEEWQLPYFEPQVLQTAPPQVTVVPTKFQTPAGGSTPDSPPQGGWSMNRGDMVIGIRMAPQYLLQSAYKWNSYARMIMPPDMPTEQYDFIANLPTGALEALQEEIKKKLGLVAEPQTIQTNAWILSVDHSDAPGLKPLATPGARVSQPNTIRLRTISSLVSFLESVTRLPILDQTGLTGTFDIQVPTSALRIVVPPNLRGQTDGRIEQLKKMLLDQLGLDLTETNAPVEMLVVKKVN